MRHLAYPYLDSTTARECCFYFFLTGTGDGGTKVKKRTKELTYGTATKKVSAYSKYPEIAKGKNQNSLSKVTLCSFCQLLV